MKKIIIIALAVLLMLPLISCGSKSDKVIDKVCKYAEKENVDVFELEMLFKDFDWFEETYDVDATPTMIVWALVDDDARAEIYEFETSKEAKEAIKGIEDYIKDADDEESDYYEDWIVVRKGNVVVAGTEEFVEYVTK